MKGPFSRNRKDRAPGSGPQEETPDAGTAPGDAAVEPGRPVVLSPVDEPPTEVERRSLFSGQAGDEPAGEGEPTDTPHDATPATSPWAAPAASVSPPPVPPPAPEPPAPDASAGRLAAFKARVPRRKPRPPAPEPEATTVPAAEQPTTVLPDPSTVPAGADPAEIVAGGASFRDRGRMRRRLRYLRRVRELGFRDLGGLVFDLHRFGRQGDHLVRGKLTALQAVDTELRALETALDDRRDILELREPGISACARCGALHSSDARYCPSCGTTLRGPRAFSEVGPIDAPAQTADPGAVASASGPVEPAPAAPEPAPSAGTPPAPADETDPPQPEASAEAPEAGINGGEPTERLPVVDEQAQRGS